MGKIEEYRRQLRGLEHWEPFLLQHSGLPGPRGNLELAQAAADEGDPERFAAWLGQTAERAPTDDPREYLAFCGVVGLGRLLAEGDRSWLLAIRQHASDPRWRLREAVAVSPADGKSAMQRWLESDDRDVR